MTDPYRPTGGRSGPDGSWLAESTRAGINRRELLAVVGLGVLAAPLAGAVVEGAAAATTRSAALGAPARARVGDWGPLQPAGKELALPAGFRYTTFGRTGSVMSDGLKTPMAHDGQFAWTTKTGRLRLLRNHEIDPGMPGISHTAIGPHKAYDRAAPGGVVSSLYDLEHDRLVESFLVLNGTHSNCSGSPTPWGTWLSCEETTDGVKHGFEKPHGYVFEVPRNAKGVIEAHPLKAMGRFEHECAPVDPRTGIIYMTEDNGDPGDGFYRFLPDVPGKLHKGGRLQMLAVRGEWKYDTTTGQRVGEKLPCSWVDIDDPDPKDAEDDPAAVYRQGRARGAAKFYSLEGATWAKGGVTFVASEAGDAEQGQIWRYEPRGRHHGVLTLLYESEKGRILNQPDSIDAGRHGLVVMGEDGNGDDPGGTNWLRVLTPDGRIANLAKVIEPLDLHYWEPDDFPEPGPTGASEISGVRWTQDGKHLICNVQYPGVTCVVSGPFGSYR